MSKSLDDWEGFHFKIIKNSDLPVVLENLRSNMFLDEPLNQLLGTSEDRLADLDEMITSYIQSGLSFFVIDRETNKVAGVQIMIYEVQGSDTPMQLRSSISETVRTFLNLMYGKINIFNDFGVSEYVHIGFTSVSREFRRRGLANEMCKRSVSLCREMKFKLIESIYSNPHSRRSAVNNGFKEIHRVYFADLQKAHPAVHFTRVPDPDEFMSVMIIKI